jgi:hypothetical protein
MQIQDSARWLAQKAELAQGEDPETGGAVLEFIEEWCARAENVLKCRDDPDDPSPPMTPLEALRCTLEGTEQSQDTWVHSHVLGQMLVAICSNWKYGVGLYDEMTELERRLVETSAAMIIGQQQESAENV